jgi:hypothetical protein
LVDLNYVVSLEVFRVLLYRARKKTSGRNSLKTQSLAPKENENPTKNNVLIQEKSTPELDVTHIDESEERSGSPADIDKIIASKLDLEYLAKFAKMNKNQSRSIKGFL